jgi:subfamily B ATP-binding cassette protein MsbA/ATP-binding cassette subfamily B protein AbcA/BmrA
MHSKHNKKDIYSFSQLIVRMLTYTKKFRWLMFAYLVVAALNTLISLAFGYIINESVGSAIDHKSSVLLALILQTVVIVVAGVCFKYLGTYLSGTFRSRVMSEVREHAVGHIQKLPLSFMEHYHSGDLISRFSNDLETVQKFIGDSLFQLIIDFITVVLTSVYLASINLKLFVVSLIIMPPILLISTFVSRPMGKFFKEASSAVGKANALAADTYSGSPIIKAYGLEGLFLSRYEEFINSSIKSNSKALHRLKFMPIFNILLWSAPFTICLIYGAVLSIHGEISPGQLPAFVYLLNNIVWPVAAIPRIVADFQQSTGTARRFFEIMDTPTEREEGMDFGVSDSEECIDFRNVIFSYEKGKLSDGSREVNERGIPVLNSLSFSVRKGCKVAIVGASGCGKSTVLKLIVGFYENESGAIDLWGHNLSKWSLRALRDKISYVSQETFLYPASIRDNIAMGRTNASEEEILQAARAANALDFIIELPEGIDTMVGERGIMLSGGQRQRLALARAFLQNSSIILLDEPTSALDTISEAQVQEALNRILEGRTVIIVTHRFSTIKDVDEIMVMDEGRITERGTHQQLMNADGLYTRLYNRQLERQGLD